MRAWQRVLRVRLVSTSRHKTLMFGTDNNLNISVDCYKYMSTLKDTAIIKIDNLTYREILEIIDGQYFDIEVEAGYQGSSINKIFSGGVLHVSNTLNGDRTNTCNILCTSKMIAKYSQQRLNLSFNSGVNMYSALKYVFKVAGIPNSNVSSQFKKRILTETETINATAASYVDSLCSENGTFITNTDDGESNAIVTLFDASKTNKRTIDLTGRNCTIVGGYPQMSSDGVDFMMLPTVNLACGDVIKLDNSLIDISVSASGDSQALTSAVTESAQKAFWLDKEELYMVFQLHYCLQNRGQAFTLSVNAKSRNLISKYIGS